MQAIAIAIGSSLAMLYSILNGFSERKYLTKQQSHQVPVGALSQLGHIYTHILYGTGIVGCQKGDGLAGQWQIYIMVGQLQHCELASANLINADSLRDKST